MSVKKLCWLCLLGLNMGATAATFEKVEERQARIPVMAGVGQQLVLQIVVHAREGGEDVLEAIELDALGTAMDQAEIAVYATGAEHSWKVAEGVKLDRANAKGLVFTTKQVLEKGKNHLTVTAKFDKDLPLDAQVDLTTKRLKFSKSGIRNMRGVQNDFALRVGRKIATGGDEVDLNDGKKRKSMRFRIPGMVTTQQDHLVTVFDIRWGQHRDLPGDIDVGVRRSEDGGDTWRALGVAMDQGEAFGKAQDQNGVGDPAILVDPKTGHLYAVGLWAHGLSSGWYWGLSKQGMKPEETGQVVLVKSTDDGKTWSQPINITEQIKDPNWTLLLNGPGAGITLRDGTLVFAAQFQEPENKRRARSSIFYSKDGGNTWKVGKGVPHPQETTEAQVVELVDGRLMLNCRVTAGGRAVYTTKDMGETWQEHKVSERGVLPMSGCMASILRYGAKRDGDSENVLLFSGPADAGRARRTHMGIRYSKDEGKTWSEPYILDELGGSYSCLSVIERKGKKEIGIIYEGSQAYLVFERLTLEEIMGKKKR